MGKSIYELSEAISDRKDALRLVGMEDSEALAALSIMCPARARRVAELLEKWEEELVDRY